jgi:hypothetical protein
MPNRLLRSPMHLIAALLVVLGLALSVPASCWCSTGDHVGMLIHPLFPHHHGDAHGPWVDDTLDGTAATSGDTSALDVPLLLIGTSVPDAGGRGLAGGEIALPALLAMLLLTARRLRAGDSPSSVQFVLAPTSPPPRVVLAAR